MRCPHCQHETRERARFCGTCGASLDRMVACPRCAALQPQGKRFCDSCGEALSLDGGAQAPPRDARAYTPRHLAEKIFTTRGALEGERKQVSILFVDVVDSMRLADGLGAEDWHRILDRVFEILASSIRPACLPRRARGKGRSAGLCGHAPRPRNRARRPDRHQLRRGGGREDR